MNIQISTSQTRSKKAVPDTTTQLVSLKALVLHLVLLLLLHSKAEPTLDQRHHPSDRTLDQTLDHSVANQVDHLMMAQTADHSVANQDHTLAAMTVH